MSPFEEPRSATAIGVFLWGTGTVIATTEHSNIAKHRALPAPCEIKRWYPASAEALNFVAHSRRRLEDILARRDHRLLVVVGPCSIHDPEAAMDYAGRLRALAHETRDSLYLVMRAYVEKPRTALGWKGLINDPHLNDSFDVEEGIRRARRLLLDITESGVPVATEALDPMTPRYLQDLITWSAIGARTAESQTHREMASGLSSTVGVKNGTDGSFTVAINALKSVGSPHRTLGIDADGRIALIETRGNANAHIVLRGGSSGPNYDVETVRRCKEALTSAGLADNIVVDCSHGNSNKDHRRQHVVLDAVAEQIAAGDRSIVGVMLESNIAAGSQELGDGSDLAYGVSITDACLGWNDTETALRGLAQTLRQPLLERLAPAMAS